MNSNQELARQLENTLALKAPPVALIFSDTPLPGVPKVQAAAPAGCGYWKRAAQGELFYTNAEDHLGCAVGAFTHGAPLSPADQTNLMDTVGMMIGLGYLSESEVAQIPKRNATLAIVTYGPLSLVPRDPDVVLLRGTPRAAMLLTEAAHALGVRSEAPPVIRPACAMVPAVLATARATTSFGCIGNRVYTGLADDEVWFALSGHHLGALVSQLAIVAKANEELESFHRARAG
ncbi:MAG TPA: DUF169 domain-containing protein [Polyangiaceae bacterium]